MDMLSHICKSCEHAAFESNHQSADALASMGPNKSKAVVQNLENWQSEDQCSAVKQGLNHKRHHSYVASPAPAYIDVSIQERGNSCRSTIDMEKEAVILNQAT